MSACPFASICWRRAYTDSLVKYRWPVPPDRATMFMQGYATADMMPRGGLFAETMPHMQDGVGMVGLCPDTQARPLDTCGEYRKEAGKRQRFEQARARRRQFADANPRTHIPQELRREVARRDKYQCVYCGVSARAVKCHVDHVVPLARGGDNSYDNLALSCSRCNNAKGSDVWARGCRMGQNCIS